MGWTGTRYYGEDTAKNRQIKITDIIETEWGRTDRRYQVIKSCMKGKTYYAAVKHPDGNIFGLVVLTTMNDGWLDYKEICEEQGPCECDCPESILSLLSDTSDPEALGWRKRCREYTVLKKEYEKIKNTEGSKIEVALRDGSSRILWRKKVCGHNPYWFDGEYRYRESTVRYLTNGYINYKAV